MLRWPPFGLCVVVLVGRLEEPQVAMLVLNVCFLYLNVKKLDVVEDEDYDVVKAHVLIDFLTEDRELAFEDLDLHEEICLLLLPLQVADLDQLEEVLDLFL